MIDLAQFEHVCCKPPGGHNIPMLCDTMSDFTIFEHVFFKSPGKKHNILVGQATLVNSTLFEHVCFRHTNGEQGNIILL